MKTLKRLPILLALIFSILVASCSEIDVTPRGDDDDEPIILPPPKPRSAAVAIDTVSIGG
jgi:hypothetical protein